MTAQSAIRPASELTPTGWLNWAGGENPLPAGARVSVRLRNGEVFPRGELVKGLAAAFLIWTHGGRHPSETDIVAYRVASIPALDAVTHDMEKVS